MAILEFTRGLFEDNPILSGIIKLLYTITYFVFRAVILVGGVVTGCIGRGKEYKADQFAYKLGYGDALLSALYKFYDIEVSDKKNLIDRLQQGHPKSAYRIERLEILQLSW